MAFYYIRPDEAWSLGATVTTTAGTTDTDYTDDWIVDGRIGRPARATNGTVTWTLAASSGEVGLVAICNCNATVNCTIGSGLSGTVTAGVDQGNGIRLNGFQTFTPANITGLTVGFSASSTTVVLGEVIAGKYRTLTRGPRFDAPITFKDYRRTVDAEFASIMPYDPGMVSRVMTGSNMYSATDRDLILAWFQSQRSASKPSLIVPDSSVNDAWVCQLAEPTVTQAGPAIWRVDMTFVEYPRSRW